MAIKRVWIGLTGLFLVSAVVGISAIAAPSHQAAEVTHYPPGD